MLARLSTDHELRTNRPTVITNISGRLLRVDIESLTLQVGAFQYEVLIPEFARPAGLANNKSTTISVCTRSNILEGKCDGGSDDAAVDRLSHGSLSGSFFRPGVAKVDGCRSEKRPSARDGATGGAKWQRRLRSRILKSLLSRICRALVRHCRADGG